MISRVAMGIVLAIGVAGVGCGKRAAVSDSMSGEERDALNERLAKLEETLASKSPFIFAKLAPGATDKEIDKLRLELGGGNVECLELWFRWHNGCTGHLTDLLPLGRMLSITEALQDRKEIQAVPFVDAKRKDAIKILEDGAGDGFFLDIASSNPRVFYHMLEDPYPRDYGTLQEFVTFICKVHEAGLASEKEDGTVDFDLNRYGQIEATYRQELGTAVKSVSGGR